MKSSDESFAPRMSSSKGRWHKPQSLFDRIPTWCLVGAAMLVVLYSAGIYLFGDGVGW